jgi:hypothetical protein
LHAKFLEETSLAVGELVREMETGKEFLKLRGRTRIPVACKEVGKNLVSSLICKQNKKDSNNNKPIMLVTSTHADINVKIQSI